MKKSTFHLPYNRKLVERARELRKSMTSAEKKIWFGYLKHLTTPVMRQRPIDNFIVDFYCSSHKLVIEIDGNTHNTAAEIEHDKLRTCKLSEYGLSVVRFSNDDVLKNFNKVCETLDNLLKDPP
jgi:very-short-patch-repair endonuclease